MDQLLPLQLYSCFFLLPVLWNIRRIILGKAIFLYVSATCFLLASYLRKILLWMGQNEIILYKLLEKMHGPGAICQRMKHFKINSFFIIAHLKQQGFFVWNIQTATRRLCLRFYQCPDMAVLQIKPEKTLSQYCLKQWIFLHSSVQSLLKNITVHFLLQLTVKTKNSCIIFPCYKRKCQSCIIQFSPIRIFCSHIFRLPVTLSFHHLYSDAEFFHSLHSEID